MKKEAITHGVLEDLANRNDNWDKLDGVPEKVDLLIESKADKTEVDASLELKADKQQEAWITPTLLNGATGTVKYRKNQFGRIEFSGHIKAATVSTDLFALPTGYRPDSSYNIPVIGAGGVNSYVRVYSGPGTMRAYTLTQVDLVHITFVGV